MKEIELQDGGHIYIDGEHRAIIGACGIEWLSASITQLELIAIIEHLAILKYA